MKLLAKIFILFGNLFRSLHKRLHPGTVIPTARWGFT